MRAEELWVDVTTTCHFKHLYDFSEFLLRTQKFGAVIILISGVDVCMAGVDEGLSLVNILK